ncbi:MAG: single-stranded-DNA-specific exonuclease RecJ [Acinetobacter sp.]|nr:single-stranded-DNA-specific exonuclease RecJ [Acinetobacter sp.]
MTAMHIQTRPFITSPAQFPHLPPFMAHILARRGVQSEQELELKLSHLLQPTLKGLPQAVALMNHAIEQQQHIVIVGDYDADGATSTALMVLVLRALNAKVDYVVPDRFKYGYGLTPAIADLVYEQFQPDLLITVDNGISSHEGVAKAQYYGMQVIVTDHHLTTKPTPDAEAVVNPNQLGCEFPSKSLAGVGVAFYVLACLMTERRKQQLSAVNLADYLDLVALGTYADVASLDYNNRILVQTGLQKIRQRQCRLGILALLDVAKRPVAQLQAQDFGFVIGPRLNAAGRMDHMKIGIECLLTDDWTTAYQYAEQLNRLNVERRAVENEMKEQALAEVQQIELKSEQLPAALVMYEEHWHQGVIGIVAGRLKEQFHRPSIVFAQDLNPDLLKGSARSIEGIHIRDMIERVAEQYPHLVKFFGGHAAAAGLTIEKQHFAEFKQKFNQIIAEHDDDVFQAVMWTDGELSTEELQLASLDWIDRFAPWGHKFPAPSFYGRFRVMNFRWLKEQHLKLWLALDNQQSVEAISFFARDKWDFDPELPMVDIVYSLERNEFNGLVNLQLKLDYVQSVA